MCSVYKELYISEEFSVYGMKAYTEKHLENHTKSCCRRQQVLHTPLSKLQGSIRTKTGVYYDFIHNVPYLEMTTFKASLANITALLPHSHDKQLRPN